MKIEIRPRGEPLNSASRHVHFDSLFELSEWLDSEEGTNPISVDGTQANATRDMSASRNKPELGWDLKAGWDKSVEMAFTGWDEGAEMAAEFSDKVNASWPHAEVQAMSDGIDFVYADEGDELCVESYLDGSDRYWHTPVFECNKPIVRVGVNIGALHVVNASSMRGRGMVCAAMIQQIERLGFGVQLYVIHTSANSGDKERIIARSVKVKDANEYIHPSTIAFWVAHPAAMRRISFRILEGSPYEPTRIGSSKGQTIEATSPDIDFMTPSVHAMKQSGALRDEKKMIAATIEMVEDVLKKHRQETDQFATS